MASKKQAPRLEVVSQKELCRLFGVARQTIRDWEKAGMPARRGGYVPADCFAWRRDEDKKSRRDDLDIDKDLEQARKYRADADLAELRLQERRGELVPVQAVEKNMERLCMAIRTRVLGIRGRFAPRVMGLGTMADATAALDDIAANILAAMRESADEFEEEETVEDEAA